MKRVREQPNLEEADNQWYKDPQIVVTIIVGAISAAATIIAALIH